MSGLFAKALNKFVANSYGIITEDFGYNWYGIITKDFGIACSWRGQPDVLQHCSAASKTYAYVCVDAG